MSLPHLHNLIFHLEDQTWRALSTSGAALLPFLSPDCIMQFPLGLAVTTFSNPSLRDIMLSDAFIPWLDYSLRDVLVTPLGDLVEDPKAVNAQAVLITYTAKARRKAVEEVEDGNVDGQGGNGEGTVEFNALCSSVWRRSRDENQGQDLIELEGQVESQEEKWLLCFHQQTPFEVD